MSALANSATGPHFYFDGQAEPDADRRRLAPFIDVQVAKLRCLTMNE
jgi:hypothetical protein